MSESQSTGRTKVSIAAVIVVYNDYQSLIKLIESVSGQVDVVVIIDNSDCNYTIPELVLRMPFVKYIRFSFNKGLGAGINEGVRLSKEAGCEWILLLDQDSTASNGMLDCMLGAYQRATDSSLIAMVCPDVFLLDKSAHQYPLSFRYFMVRKIKETSSEVDFSISSGSLIKVSAFEDVGLMDEALFIDYLDFDFCLRLRCSGRRILFVKEAVLAHRLGESRMSWLGFRYTYHSPKRVYYQARNRLIVVARYGLRFPSFALIQLFLFALKFFKILIIEDQKIKRLMFYFEGIRHSFGR